MPAWQFLKRKQDLQVLLRCKSNFLNSIFITTKLSCGFFKKLFESNEVMISLASGKFQQKKLKQQNFKVSEKIAHNGLNGENR